MTFQTPQSALALQAFLAYLIGSIPFAYLAGKWVKGLDLRRHGSGNLGATNVFRVLGPVPGVLVLVADVLKGAAAVLLLPRLDVGLFGVAPWWPCFLGLAAVLGHSYTIFLGFKGGKGVATSLGVFLGLAPWATLCALAVFGAVFGLTRMVSAGSLAAAAALPFALLRFHELRPRHVQPVFDPNAGWFYTRPVFVLGLVLAALVWIRHIPNIRRILAGTENRIGSKKGSQA